MLITRNSGMRFKQNITIGNYCMTSAGLSAMNGTYFYSGTFNGYPFFLGPVFNSSSSSSSESSSSESISSSSSESISSSSESISSSSSDSISSSSESISSSSSESVSSSSESISNSSSDSLSSSSESISSSSSESLSSSSESISSSDSSSNSSSSDSISSSSSSSTSSESSSSSAADVGCAGNCHPSPIPSGYTGVNPDDCIAKLDCGMDCMGDSPCGAMYWFISDDNWGCDCCCHYPPTVACCFGDYSCANLSVTDCTNYGGTPQATGTTCADIPAYCASSSSSSSNSLSSSSESISLSSSNSLSSSSESNSSSNSSSSSSSSQSSSSSESISSSSESISSSSSESIDTLVSTWGMGQGAYSYTALDANTQYKLVSETYGNTAYWSYYFDNWINRSDMFTESNGQVNHLFNSGGHYRMCIQIEHYGGSVQFYLYKVG